MLKPNRLVAMATTGKLAETSSSHRHRCAGDSTQFPADPIASEELLESLTNGLRRLCELAFGPTEQVHELASKAVTAWKQIADLSINTDRSSGQGRDHSRIAVRLLTAVALYLELCRRERAASTTGVIQPAALSRLMSVCDGHVPPEAIARCPALRRLLSQYPAARPATGRPDRIAAA